MRLSLIVSVLTVLAFAGLAAAPASAEIGRVTSRQYADCQCQFGFDGGCMPKVSCTSTGGHCAKACVAGSTTKSDDR